MCADTCGVYCFFCQFKKSFLSNCWGLFGTKRIQIKLNPQFLLLLKHVSLHLILDASVKVSCELWKLPRRDLTFGTAKHSQQIFLIFFFVFRNSLGLSIKSSQNMIIYGKHEQIFIKFKLFYIRAFFFFKVNFETEFKPLHEMCKNLESYSHVPCKMLPNSIFVTFVLSFWFKFIFLQF